MEKLNYSALFTNAMHNREQAVKLFKAGFTGKEIAKEYPLIWRVATDGRIQQRYNQKQSDGRLEIDKMMTSESVDALIAARKSEA